MKAQKTSRKAAPRPKAQGTKSTYSGIEVYTLDLFTLGVSQDPLVMIAEKDADAKYTISAVLNNVSFAERECVGYVDFEVSKAFKSKTAQSVKASYMIFLTANEELTATEWRYHLSFLAGSAAWLRYVDLFSLLNAQSSLRFPPLPNKPPSISFDESEQEGGT